MSRSILHKQVFAYAGSNQQVFDIVAASRKYFVKQEAACFYRTSCVVAKQQHACSLLSGGDEVDQVQEWICAGAGAVEPIEAGGIK